MFVAHLPAGYLLTRRIAPRPSRRLLALGLVASVLPDLDLFRFYLVDHRHVPHHAYWTHQPFWWALLAIVAFGVPWLRSSSHRVLGLKIFFTNVFAHLVLDTVAGRVRWLAPFSDRYFALFHVPVRHGWWVSNFLLHWTFLPELAITAWAGCDLAREALGAPSRRSAVADALSARRPIDSASARAAVGAACAP